MKAKKLLASAMTAAGILAGAAAHAAGGDIYDIRPCTSAGVAIDPVATIANPIGSGQDLYFKITLLPRTPGGKAWYLDYVGSGSSLVDEALYPLQIGIYVSGQLRWATLEDYTADDAGGYSQFIFKYTTQPGDFALPIVLATSQGPASEIDESIAYYLNPLRSAKWNFSNAVKDSTGYVTQTSDTCNLLYWSPSAEYPAPSLPDGARQTDYSLSGCGFYVQTIGFDEDWEEADTLWRSVHENSTITVGPDPSIVALENTTISNAVTLYAWSDDDSAVRVDGTLTAITNGYAGGAPVIENVYMKAITVAGGATQAKFPIFGVAENGTANIILSSWPGYRFDGTRQIMETYVKVPVKCIAPLPASVEVKADDTTITADADYLIAKTRLAVYLTQAATNDVTVTIDTTFEADATMTNWGDYVRFSTSANSVQTLPDATAPTVTIPAGSTERQYVYVYALRGDDKTVGTGHQVKFNPVVSAEEQAAAGIASLSSGAVYISAANPVITTPESNSTYIVTAGETMELAVSVADTYADMTDTTTGYTVRVKLNGSSSWRTLDETFTASGEDGGLVGMTTGNVPTVSYGSAGEFVTQIQVISPVSGKKSQIVPVNVTVEPAKSTSMQVYDEATGEYVSRLKECYEGQVVRFQVSLSAQNDTDKVLYAFLVPNEDIDVAMFGGTGSKAIVTDTTVAAPGTTGLQISKVGQSITSSFTVLDGASEADGGMSYTFSVALCTTKYYDPATRLDGYDTTDYLSLLVYNVEPTFTTVYLEGFEAESDGYIFANQYPRGQTIEIQPEFDDVTYDLLHGFEYKWTASCDGSPQANGTVTMSDTATEVTTLTNNNKYTTIVPADGSSTINDYPFHFHYPKAGLWTVKIQMKDKDMSKYSAVTYSISFRVIDNPQVMIEPDDTYYETDAKAKIPVTLGYFESDDPIVVKLTVTPPDGPNPGTLLLDDQYKAVPDGLPALADNEYYVTFTQAETISVGIALMDGTALSSSRGFVLKGEVVSTGVSTDSSLTWAEYYVPYSTKVYIENEAPKFGYVTLENTNAWKVAGGAATSYPINWAIKNDVMPDFTNLWANGTGPGIKVTFLGCENATEFYVTDTDDWSGKFVPNFGTVQGEQSVTLTIEDKDGGMQTWTYLYEVKPSKFLETVAHGPAGASADNAYSVYYEHASGLGKGHVFASGSTFSDAANFHLNWNYSSASKATVYGWGYKSANPVDNGTLDGGFDVGIDPLGNTWTAGDYYTYTSVSNVDSYLYAWIWGMPATEAGDTEWRLRILPETPNSGIDSLSVLLPTGTTEDGNYIPVVVEGVFSEEFYPEDNVGDINKDGIPDVFAVKEWGGGQMVNTTTDGENTTINDMVSLNTYNEDGDFLPGVYGTSDYKATLNYAPIGVPFTARLEIRGFHDGLNATDVTISDPSYSEDEQKAFEAAGSPAGWSPEPQGEYVRMDPTLADTDGDGFPDGWEYYFWYLAHVWYPAQADAAKPRDGQAYVFERFNLDSPLRGDPIDPAEVEARFNPVSALQPKDYADNPDFDGDGLTDLEELVLGTNPCHWDTDGDHMCDSWEVMWGLNPLGSDKMSNPDGDWMAAYSTLFDFVWFDPATGASPFEEGVRDYVLWGVPTEKLQFNLGFAEVLEDFTCYGISFTPKMDINTGDPLFYGLENDLPDPDKLLTTPVYWGYNMVDEIAKESVIEMHAGDILFQGITFVLIHDQVFTAFGFDPRTAWNSTGNGYVHNRWDPTVNPELSPLDSTGAAVNTVPYYTYDEYLVMMYRRQYGIEYTTLEEEADWDPGNMWGTFIGRSTNPNVPTQDEIITNESEEINDDGTTNVVVTVTTNTVPNPVSTALAAALAAAGSEKNPLLSHGADTDSDGVPDGWELYTYRNPNAPPPGDKDEYNMAAPVPGDFDADGLTYAFEFAGTDSCQAYANVPSIYNNHPGHRSGWWNKFFPTHPGTMMVMGFDEAGEYVKQGLWGAGNSDGADTDGDGITDAAEGGSWKGTFYNGGRAYLSDKFTFIYGEIEDRITCCFRGGGMNPCTIDTDQDGLPDAWEMSYCGVVADAINLVSLNPDVETIDDTTWIADGLLGDAAVKPSGESAIYIAGGMDATFADAGSPCIDPLIGGEDSPRDVDFDHDGLENWQEYLVQSMRHFRYDDISTPLMGRILTEGEYDMEQPMPPLLNAHEQQFVDYVPFDYSNAADFLNKNLLAYWGLERAPIVRERTTYSGQVFQYPWGDAAWKALGYMAPPVHGWDRSYTAQIFGDPRYQYAVVSAYVSTDPRMADSDGDGMDDYYELYHGLNPILGSDYVTAGDGRDLIAQAWGMPTTFNAYLNEWIFPWYNGIQGRTMGTLALPVTGPVGAPMCYDPVLYPWLMGSAMADPDGDGMRNDDERLLANVADPQARHTDPTPLWFTEHTTPMSYVWQYYRFPAYAQIMMMFGPPMLPTEIHQLADYSATSMSFLYSFEEGEGYDTDGDFKPDNREVVQTVTAETDPQVFMDPARRQALYLDGVDSFAMSKLSFYRPIQAVDLLKQFTVECWVNPEKIGEDQTIIDRVCAYPGASGTTDSFALRSNFRIGLTKDGRLYGMFDNSDSIESGRNSPVSCQTVTAAGVLPTNEWSHVALSFDGSRMVLYINGAIVGTAGTSLIPANGVVEQNQYIGSTNALSGAAYEQLLQSALFVGARPQKQTAIALYPIDAATGLTEDEAYSCYKEFYQGYVDEVRIWDGARPQKDIRADINERYDFKKASDNRYSVFLAYSLEEATRNANDGKPNLPPELVFHYSFSSLPGAVKAEDAAKTLPGYNKNVAYAATNSYTSAQMDTENLYVDGLTPAQLAELKGGQDGAGVNGDLLVKWWNDNLTHSKVYSDYRRVPWIQNTVQHLPLIDGSVSDSTIYADWVGALYNLAEFNDVSKYIFPNNAFAESSWFYSFDHLLRLEALERLAEAYSSNATAQQVYQLANFKARSEFIGTTDLVPMGGAYAKTCPELWDGHVGDAWEYTGADEDGDGLPDKWEDDFRRYYAFDLENNEALEWNTEITLNGIKLPAWRWYALQLARGLQPDGTIDPAYASTVDTDNDSLPDWWENMFAIADEDGDDDNDHDGLSNYAEYKIWAVDGVDYTDPTLIRTDNVLVDYFRQIEVDGTNYYLGELYSDHDFMETAYEKFVGADKNIYDAYADYDEDGWGAWAELRYCDSHRAILPKYRAHTYTGEEMPDYPVPVIHATLRYNGTKDVSSNATIIVEAYDKNDLSKVPTARWTVTAGEASDHFYSLGHYDPQTFRGTLAPGHIVGGLDSIWLQRAFIQQTDLYTWTIEGENGLVPHTGTYEEWYAEYLKYGTNLVLSTEAFEWSNVQSLDGTHGLLQISVNRTDPSKSRLLFGDVYAGTIDMETGDFSLDMSKLARYYDAETLVAFRQCLFRLSYKARIPSLDGVVTASLEAADSGALKEGANTFVAYIDTDSNGEFTVGADPIGFVKNVRVGWDNVPELSIEMLDKAAAGFRYSYGNGGAAAAGDGEEAASSTDITSIRVVRVSVNGQTAIKDVPVVNRVVYRRNVADFSRDWIFDGDFTGTSNGEDGRFGLDWTKLQEDINAMRGITMVGVTNVGYVVLSDQMTIADLYPTSTVTNDLEDAELGQEVVTVTNAMDVSLALAYFSVDYAPTQTAPQPISPTASSMAILQESRPTFKWTGASDCTAFSLQIATDTNTVVYTSPVQSLPSRDIQGRYVWQAPAYLNIANPAGDGWVLENNTKYYWRVQMYNPKFSTVASAKWSPWAEFTTAATGENDPNESSYGTADVCVRYFGPATNDLSKVIVALYKNADFMGAPVARSRIPTDETSLSVLTGETAVVRFVGLPDGDYYAMAFIDASGNNSRDAFESWGYANQVGLSEEMIYRPVPVAVDVNVAKTPLATVYIEDTDINQNKILDCFEDPALFATSEGADSMGGDIEEGGGGSSGGGDDGSGGGEGGGEGGGSGDGSGDDDADGLSNSYELNNTYTDPTLWDTDGDGTPDGWENWSKSDPLTADSDTLVEGDTMAWAVLDRVVVTDTNGLVFVLKEGVKKPVVGDELEATDLLGSYVYYTDDGSGELQSNIAMGMPKTEVAVVNPDVTNVLTNVIVTVTNAYSLVTNDFDAAFAYLEDSTNAASRATNYVDLVSYRYSFRTNVLESGSVTNYAVAVTNVSNFADMDYVAVTNWTTNIISTIRVDGVASTNVVIMHAQVYDMFGFNPKTAIPYGSVNSKDFTALDKYQVVRYLEGLGLANEDSVNRNRLWSQYTLKANQDDLDRDGVADGWELYTMFGPSGAGSCSLSEVKISPWNYDDARSEEDLDGDGLNTVGEYGQGLGSTDPWVADTDGDGITDNFWHEYFLYDYFGDEDGDGLSNYAEYLLTEVFGVGEFDPANAHSLSANEIDYFYPIGSLYAGEIFTDHDMMLDSWEVLQGSDYVSPKLWDASSDNDEDGWSAFAERRYDEFTSSIIAHNISHTLGDAEMGDFPIPTLKLTLRYNQSQKLTGSSDEGGSGGSALGAGEGESATLAPIIVQTFTDKALQEKNVVPDATFKIQSGASSEHHVYLGAYTEKTLGGVLTPGYIDTTSLDIEYAYLPSEDDIFWSFTSPATSETKYFRTSYEPYLAYLSRYGEDYVTMLAGDGSWQSFTDVAAITVTQDPDTGKGKIRMGGEPVGTLDSTTGEFTMSLAPFQHWIGESTNDTGNIYMKDCIFRISYNAKLPVLGANKLKVYLGAADSGYVREGKNHIVAFYDLDGSGEYSPGEPLAYADNVDVGWYQGVADMELTDTSPVITRALVTSQESSEDDSGSSADTGSKFQIQTDRNVLYGDEDGDYYDLVKGSLSGGTYQRFRVVRTLVNGYGCSELGIPNTVVVDKWLELDQRPFFFEGDVLSETEFDLDWSYFQNTVAAVQPGLDVTSVVYRVVLGNGTIDSATTNNLLSVATVHHFDANGNRVRPVAVDPGSTVSILYGARPTFKWSMGQANTYTAFRLQVLSGSSTVWDSGIQHAPARDSDGNYVYTPNLFAGDTLQAGRSYTWRVTMYNAKFQTNLWSAPSQEFFVGTSSSGEGYGSIPVCVRYYGPSASAGTIRVEAFTNPDFSGLPVARATASKSNLASFTAAHKANATLVGLEAGTYYIRAYIDSTAYGTAFVKDSFESWGYACPREGDLEAPYKPLAVTLSADAAGQQTVTVHIEDVDANNNAIPDLYEIAHNGGSLENGATANLSLLPGGIVLNKSLASISAGSGSAADFILGTTVASTLSMAPVAELVLGVDGYEGGLAQAIDDATEVVDGSLAVTAMALDADANTVTLTVEAEVENTLVGSATPFYTFTGSKVVTLKIWKKDSLEDADWALAKTVEDVALGNESADVTVDLGEGVDLSSGFFKVTIE